MTLGAPPTGGGPAPSPAPAATAADAPDALASAGARRTRTRWRVAIRLARRDARRDLGSTLLVAGLLAVVVAVVSMALVVQTAYTTPGVGGLVLGEGVEAELTWAGAPVLQSGPTDAQRVLVGSPGAAASWEDVAARLHDALPGASGWATTGCSDVIVGGADARRALLCTLLVLDATAGKDGFAEPSDLATGRAPQDPDEVVVPVGTDAVVGGALDVRIGDDVRTLRVVGTYVPTPGALVELRVGPGHGTVLAPHATTVRITDPAVAWADLVRLNAAGFHGPARAAAADPPARDAIPFLVAGHTTGANDPPTVSGPSTEVIVLGTVAATLVLVLIVTPSQVVVVRRRTRTYALLAAVGAAPRTLRALVLAGAALQGALAAVVGMTVGVLARVATVHLAPVPAGETAERSVTVPWASLVLVLVGTVTLVVTAALVPARSAGRVDVVRVLAGRRGEVPPSRRTTVAGLGLVACGLALGAWALSGSLSGLVSAALVVLCLGVLLSAGGFVTGVARVLAPRASLPVRLALRDATRNRSRSVAAVLAVAAAAAVLVGTSLSLTSGIAHARATATPAAGEGTVVAYVNPEVVDGTAALDRVEAAVHRIDPHARIVRVTTPSVRAGGTDAAPEAGVAVDVAPNVARTCPWVPVEGPDGSAENRRLAREDPRCAPSFLEEGGAWTASVFVDDGTWSADLGLDAALAASAVLANGRAALASSTLLQDDGTVRVRVIPDVTEDAPAPDDAIPWTSIPATVVPGLDRTQFMTILPTTVVANLGLGALPVGAVVHPSEASLTAAVEAAADTALGSAGWASPGVRSQLSSTVVDVSLMAAAAVLGIGTAGLVILLVAGEARADLAVLHAVGAAPRTRRRLLAAQSGVLVGLGTALGALLGLAVALGYVALSARKQPGPVDPTWVLTVPWTQIAVVLVLLPLGAWLTGWLTTRSRLPLPSEVR
ncbi:FtsX-like permease family protein [Sanguibacter massiliensis]|uniref:FtsX-like permease family protein n=1 Tax=Sanguibacter massiliensis TaxID=1973217 RepID=UPI000C828E1B|nr:FtsX-like permease family protein [Sanguibacter massiliensis]